MKQYSKKPVFLDAKGWHRGHNVTAVSCFGGVGVRLVCLDCLLSADLQAVSTVTDEASSRADKSQAAINE